MISNPSLLRTVQLKGSSLASGQDAPCFLLLESGRIGFALHRSLPFGHGPCTWQYLSCWNRKPRIAPAWYPLLGQSCHWTLCYRQYSCPLQSKRYEWVAFYHWWIALHPPHWPAVRGARCLSMRRGRHARQQFDSFPGPSADSSTYCTRTALLWILLSSGVAWCSSLLNDDGVRTSHSSCRKQSAISKKAQTGESMQTRHSSFHPFCTISYRHPTRKDPMRRSRAARKFFKMGLLYDRFTPVFLI